MRDYEVPDSLQEWADLNDQADAAEKRGDTEAWRALGEEIEAAWHAAPWRDRARVDWDLLKKVWRERRQEQMSG